MRNRSNESSNNEYVQEVTTTKGRRVLRFTPMGLAQYEKLVASQAQEIKRAQLPEHIQVDPKSSTKALESDTKKEVAEEKKPTRHTRRASF